MHKTQLHFSIGIDRLNGLREALQKFLSVIIAGILANGTCYAEPLIRLWEPVKITQQMIKEPVSAKNLPNLLREEEGCMLYFVQMLSLQKSFYFSLVTTAISIDTL